MSHCSFIVHVNILFISFFIRNVANLYPTTTENMTLGIHVHVFNYFNPETDKISTLVLR